MRRWWMAVAAAGCSASVLLACGADASRDPAHQPSQSSLLESLMSAELIGREVDAIGAAIKAACRDRHATRSELSRVGSAAMPVVNHVADYQAMHGADVEPSTEAHAVVQAGDLASAVIADSSMPMPCQRLRLDLRAAKELSKHLR